MYVVFAIHNPIKPKLKMWHKMAQNWFYYCASVQPELYSACLDTLRGEIRFAIIIFRSRFPGWAGTTGFTLPKNFTPRLVKRINKALHNSAFKFERETRPKNEFRFWHFRKRRMWKGKSGLGFSQQTYCNYFLRFMDTISFLTSSGSHLLACHPTCQLKI